MPRHLAVAAPTSSLEWLIVSGAVYLGGWSVWYTGNGLNHQFITLTVNICVQQGEPEALRRVGVSGSGDLLKLPSLLLCEEVK